MALDFELSDDQRMIQESIRKLLGPFQAKRDEYRRRMRERVFPSDLWEAVAGAGFLGCMIPEQWGGSNMGLLAMTLLIEEMMTLGFGHALFVLTTMDALCIVRSGSDELRGRILPRIASGELKLAFAVTEADAGTNTFRIRTTARPDGEHYVVNGSKQWITAVDAADYVLVVARTTTYEECVAQGLPKSHGMTLLLIDPKSPGVTLQPVPTGSIEGATQYTIFFDNVRVPVTDRVGGENEGAIALFLALNPERILATAMTLGVSEFCLRTAVEYAKERKLFKNTPIGAYQAIQHPLAEAKIRQEATRLMCYRAAWSFDRGDNPLQTGMYTNMAKWLGSELGVFAVDKAIQTLGGNGFSEEFGLIHFWEGMRLLKTAPISNEMVLNSIAEHLLGLPKSY